MKRFFFLPLLLMACTGLPQPTDNVTYETQPITLQGDDREINLEVEVAITGEQRAKGLMFREVIGTDGMLFVFADERTRSFWMKNTLIPLDILYFDTDGFVVSTTTMQPCTTDVCPNYSSVLPAKYALEVNAGWVEEQEIGKGWKLVP
jgi:uncharacterized membrane protein (UPF0127 family)